MINIKEQSPPLPQNEQTGSTRDQRNGAVRGRADRAFLLVVTPTLGTAPTLDDTVESVRRFAGKSAVHLLVCPAARVEYLKIRYPACEVYPDEGPGTGLYGAINAGLGQAASKSWEWFTYINDDDGLLPGFDRLIKQLAAEVGQPPEEIHYGHVRLVGPGGYNIGRIPVSRAEEDLLILAADGISAISQPGSVFSRKVVEKLRRFRTDLKICGDLDYWMRARKAGIRFRFFGDDLAFFSVRPGQLSGNVGKHLSEFKAVAQENFPDGGSLGRHLLAHVRYRLSNLLIYINRLYFTGFCTGLDVLSSPPTNRSSGDQRGILKGCFRFALFCGTVLGGWLALRSSSNFKTISWMPAAIANWAERHGELRNLPAFALLGGAIFGSFEGSRNRRSAFAAYAVFGAALEGLQIFMPARFAEWSDVILSWAGLAVAYVLGAMWLKISKGYHDRRVRGGSRFPSLQLAKVIRKKGTE